MGEIRTEARRLCVAGVLACAVPLGASAQAALVQTVSVQSGYAYYFDSGHPQPSVGPDTAKIFENYTGVAAPYKGSAGIDYTSQADPNNFYFLHNDYCVGVCTAASYTDITFTVTNNGPSVEQLRFDSLITPGHLARFGTDSRMSGDFSFIVNQTTPANSTNPLDTHTLYSAMGTITPTSLSIDAGRLLTFNNQNTQNFSDGEVVDWSATNLNLNLTDLQPGDTTQITYSSRYFVTTTSFCFDLQVGCSGAQVVFGDPRTNGGGSDLEAADAAVRSFASFAAVPNASPAQPSVRDLINRDYDPYMLTARIVDQSTPLPDTPDQEPILTYGGNFTPPDVPEPATWATMLLGFSLVGIGARRRRLRPA